MITQNEKTMLFIAFWQQNSGDSTMLHFPVLSSSLEICCRGVFFLPCHPLYVAETFLLHVTIRGNYLYLHLISKQSNRQTSRVQPLVRHAGIIYCDDGSSKSKLWKFALLKSMLQLYFQLKTLFKKILIPKHFELLQSYPWFPLCL